MYDPGSVRAGAVAAFIRAVGTVLVMVGHDDIRASDHSCSAGVSLMPVGAWSWVNPAMSAAVNILFVSSSIRWWMRFGPINFDHVHCGMCVVDLHVKPVAVEYRLSLHACVKRRDVSCVRFMCSKACMQARR